MGAEVEQAFRIWGDNIKGKKKKKGKLKGKILIFKKL
jgi:hypothetical protein